MSGQERNGIEWDGNGNGHWSASRKAKERQTSVVLRAASTRLGVGDRLVFSSFGAWNGTALAIRWDSNHDEWTAAMARGEIEMGGSGWDQTSRSKLCVSS